MNNFYLKSPDLFDTVLILVMCGLMLGGIYVLNRSTEPEVVFQEEAWNFVHCTPTTAVCGWPKRDQ